MMSRDKRKVLKDVNVIGIETRPKKARKALKDADFKAEVSKSAKDKFIELASAKTRSMLSKADGWEKNQWKLSDFEILETLGSGANAKVVKAREKTSNHELALKIQDSQNSDEYGVHCMVSSHPSILHCYGSFEEENGTNCSNYLILELCVNGSLLDVVQTSSDDFPYEKLCEKDAARYISDVLNGLTALQKESVIHRDIKPQNIVIDKEGRAKICDFGLAVHTFSKPNADAGTPYFMAPEYITAIENVSDDYDHRTDIWSCGAVLYFVLTGTIPYFDHMGLRAVYASWFSSKSKDDLVLPGTISYIDHLSWFSSKYGGDGDGDDEFSFPDIGELALVYGTSLDLRSEKVQNEKCIEFTELESDDEDNMKSVEYGGGGTEDAPCPAKKNGFCFHFEEELLTTIHGVNDRSFYPLRPVDIPEHVSEEAKSLIWSLLEADPNKRISLADALKHPWIKKHVS